MRLWSLHPKYLDTKGLLAVWREGLLAQKVLQGKTKGYKNHSQLIRFKQNKKSLDAIASYLLGVWFEANFRQYNFDCSKIISHNSVILTVTRRQLIYEFKHLQKKLFDRDIDKFTDNLCDVNTTGDYDYFKIETHPALRIIEGEIESWEKV